MFIGERASRYLERVFVNPIKPVALGALIILIVVLLASCGSNQSTPLAELPSANVITQTPTATVTGTSVPTGTATATATRTATHTTQPTSTPTFPPTDTPTITPSPTYEYPTVTVLMQANCRYGPGTAYLYSWGLYPGDTAVVHGRNSNGTWLWIKPDNLNRHCWMAASVAEVHGDIFIPFPGTPGTGAGSGTSLPPLPYTTFAGPPGNVQAFRDGDQVTVTWDEVPLSDDKRRGYLLEATVCQNGELTWLAVQTYATAYTFTDESTCDGESGALLYTAEKHGYSDPVSVPWP